MPVNKEILDRIKRQESRTIPGADVLTPKQRLLDASDVQSKHPQSRVRWVSLRDPMKVQARQADGYEILSTEQGGRRLGDESVLMACPRETYEARVAAQDRLTQDRLNAHKYELERAVEGVARLLRDKHGLDVDLDRLMIRE